MTAHFNQFQPVCYDPETDGDRISLWDVAPAPEPETAAAPQDEGIVFRDLSDGARAELTAALSPQEYRAATDPKRNPHGASQVLIERPRLRGARPTTNGWVARIREHYVLALPPGQDEPGRAATGRTLRPIWAYKHYSLFATPEDALAAARIATTVS